MPEITHEASTRQIEAIAERVRASQREGDLAAAVAGLHELLAHPCAPHQVVAFEVWDELHEVHKQAGDYDAAIAARAEAVRLGYRSEPDPDADIAHCHLMAGRRSVADELFAELRQRTPEDVWLYNSAGFSYAEAGDAAEAARWFRDGIDLALRTGDPDQVVVQLLDGLEAAWADLGETPEPGLAARVDAFVEAWQPPTDRGLVRWLDDDEAAEPAAEDRPCAYCGYEPDRSLAEARERRRRRDRKVIESDLPEALARLDALASGEAERPRQRLAGPALLSVAWFPRPEWARAIEAWPDLLAELPADHGAYSHEIEARIKRIVRADVGCPLQVAPLSVEGLVAYCDAHDEAPGTAEGRAAYAAELSRLGEGVPWPPGRNDPCWCRSGRKYKGCCGPVPPANR